MEEKVSEVEEICDIDNVIEENYIVNPDQVEVLDATENATITLITCTVGSKQRVIVKGTLQSTEDL